MIDTEDVEIIEAVIESFLLDINVHLPAKVTKIDTGNRRVDVEVQVERLLETDDGKIISEVIGELKDIEIDMMRDNEYFFSLPCAVGTTGVIYICDYSIDRWLTFGKRVHPGDIRRHDLNGAVFSPGLVPRSKRILDSISEGLALGKIGGPQLRINASAVEATSGGAPNASDFVALAAKVDDFIQKIDTVIRTAWVPAPQDGGAALKTAYVAALPLAPTTVASTNLKAD
jgi:hypothetical protein